MERMWTSPTYGMFFPADEKALVGNEPPMVVFPNMSEFYEKWRVDLESRGVKVRRPPSSLPLPTSAADPCAALAGPTVDRGHARHQAQLDRR